jgi:hypothetical protein
MKEFKVPVKVTFSIRRPNGDLEFVVHPTLKTITEDQFKKIQKDTAAAGRGNVFDYKIEYKTEMMMTSNIDRMRAASTPCKVSAMSRMGE